VIALEVLGAGDGRGIGIELRLEAGIGALVDPSDEASVGEFCTRSWKIRSNTAVSRASPLPALEVTRASAGASVSGSRTTVALVARKDLRSMNSSRDLG